MQTGRINQLRKLKLSDLGRGALCLSYKNMKYLGIFLFGILSNKSIDQGKEDVAQYFFGVPLLEQG